MECISVDENWIFEIFTRGSREESVFILDVRPYKYFRKKHIIHAYCIRLTSDRKSLVDYSKGLYDVKWGQSIWWGRDVFVYGDDNVRKNHSVLEFLILERKAKSIRYYKHGFYLYPGEGICLLKGFEAFEEKFPFLCTVSVKQGSWKSYPSVLIPKLLYLGSWEDTENLDRLKEINIKNVVTIHNNPEELKLLSRFHHLRIELPDIPTADISVHFNSVYAFIEAARDAEAAVLVHCGAGVSRSATLCVAYLMRYFAWGAIKARSFVYEKRKKIAINQGFWAVLCQLQKALGINDPIDLDIEEPLEDVKISEEATGIPVSVIFTEYGASAPAEESKKRPMHDETSESTPKRQKRAETDNEMTRTIKFEVSKQNKKIGTLVIGPLARHQRCVFGRSPNVDIVLEHASVSRQHAKIELNISGEALLTDLGSSLSSSYFFISIHFAVGHGTNLDEMWIRAKNPKALHEGSSVGFGASTRTYKVIERFLFPCNNYLSLSISR